MQEWATGQGFPQDSMLKSEIPAEQVRTKEKNHAI
jgi:hypothetical protein